MRNQMENQQIADVVGTGASVVGLAWTIQAFD